MGLSAFSSASQDLTAALAVSILGLSPKLRTLPDWWENPVDKTVPGWLWFRSSLPDE
jgi:hypothetical protein